MSWRAVYPDIDDQYGWFDYRSRGFEDDPKRGLRIDHILVSKPLIERMTGCGITLPATGDGKTIGSLPGVDHCRVAGVNGACRR